MIVLDRTLRKASEQANKQDRSDVEGGGEEGRVIMMSDDDAWRCAHLLAKLVMHHVKSVQLGLFLCVAKMIDK